METDTGLAFGDLLRRHRDSAGITQESLAEMSGLTPQAIGLIERGERRRPHRHTVQKLAKALALTGQDLARFESAAHGSSTRRAKPSPSRRDVPVPTTPLLGREHEVAAVTALLRREDVRLVTLAGPGGVGKTRLAFEVARRSGGSFADGVAFVSLAPLRDHALVPSALAEALGLRDVKGQTLRETLEAHLRGRQTLLLFDNFEHLLSAVSLVAGLLGACPRLTVLATSRAPLHLGGEHQFPVPPLPVPEEEVATTGDVLARSPAVELFCQRARAVSPVFALTPANAAAVTRICRRVDGLPLAIELAAARTKLFSAQVLLGRLDRRLPLLSGGARDLPERQQTLRRAVAWSYELLCEGKQSLFRRLAVFAGGCTVEAAEAVCAPGASGPEEMGILEGMAALVDNSLLVVRPGPSAGREDEEPRFAMLETIREYTVERLEASGETEEVRRRHAAYFLALAESLQPEVSPEREGDWIERLEEVHDDLRSALRWTVGACEAETGGRLVLMLWRLWAERGHSVEGRRWAEAVLALDDSETRAARARSRLPAHKRAFLIHVAGILATAHGDYDGAATLYEESLNAFRDLDYKKGLSAPLRELGVVAYHQGDYESAVRLNEQALAIAREYNSAFGIAYTLFTLSDAVSAFGDSDRAAKLLEESLALFRGLDHTWGISHTLTRLGNLACEAGEDARAEELYAESLDLVRRWGLSFDAAASLEGLARVAAMQGQPARAVRLCAAAEAVREDVGVPLSPANRAGHERTVAAARTTLGEDEFAAAWDVGYTLPLEEAIVEALRIDG